MGSYCNFQYAQSLKKKDNEFTALKIYEKLYENMYKQAMGTIISVIVFKANEKSERKQTSGEISGKGMMKEWEKG